MAIPRPRPRKSSALARARASGFSSKLRRWFAENQDHRDSGQGDTGPRNGRQLARLLTSLGEPVTETAISLWRRGKSLPDPRYIGPLERLMGAPWSYLDHPGAPWPRPLTADRLNELLAEVPEDVLERFGERLRAELAAPPRRSSGR